MNKLLPVLAALALASCADLPPPSEWQTSSRPSRPAKPPKAADVTRYGPWEIPANSCRLRGYAQNFEITSKGDVTETGHELPLRITFYKPQGIPPRVEITGLPVPIKVEGRGPTSYTITIPYTNTSAARMLQDDAWIIISHFPGEGGNTLETSLPANGLMYALSDIAFYCQ